MVDITKKPGVGIFDLVPSSVWQGISCLLILWGLFALVKQITTIVVLSKTITTVGTIETTDKDTTWEITTRVTLEEGSKIGCIIRVLFDLNLPGEELSNNYTWNERWFYPGGKCADIDLKNFFLNEYLQVVNFAMAALPQLVFGYLCGLFGKVKLRYERNKTPSTYNPN